jgi:hypothetical protein
LFGHQPLYIFKFLINKKIIKLLNSWDDGLWVGKQSSFPPNRSPKYGEPYIHDMKTVWGLPSDCLYNTLAIQIKVSHPIEEKKIPYNLSSQELGKKIGFVSSG